MGGLSLAPGDTPARDRQRANQAAIVQLVNLAAAAELAAAIADTRFASYQEAVAVRDVGGRWLRKRVVEVDTGRDFPCHDVAWEGEQVWSPWPIEDVRPLAEHPDALTREEFQRGR